MVPLRETLEAIKTWAILAGDVEEITHHIPDHFKPCIFDAAMSEELARITVAEWQGGELLVDVGGVEVIARACIRRGVRYLAIVPADRADVLKAALTHEEKACRKS